jgi:hypothetical protein
MVKNLFVPASSQEQPTEKLVDPVSSCDCGAPAVYTCSGYSLCEDCSWALAEAGGAP